VYGCLIHVQSPRRGLATLGYIDNSILTLNKAAKLAETSGNITAAGYVYERLEWSHLYTGDYDKVLAYKEKVILKMKEEFNLRCYVFALSGVTLAYIDLGRWAEAMEVGQKNLSVTEESGDNSLISRSARDLTLLCASKGDLARAIEYGELSSQKAPTPADKAWAQRSLGWAWCRAGEPNKGIQMLVAVLPIFLKGDFMPGTIPAMCHLGEGHWLAGEDDKARETLEKGLEIADRCGAKYYAGFARRLLGELSLKTDQVQATTDFKKSIDILQEIKAENELALAYAGYGRLHKKQGEIAQAREYLIKALEIFERLGTLIEPDKVREELATLNAV
jgi:tetratricopeptide (TPR) repeat protein